MTAKILDITKHPKFKRKVEIIETYVYEPLLSKYINRQLTEAEKDIINSCNRSPNNYTYIESNYIKYD